MEKNMDIYDPCICQSLKMEYIQELLQVVYCGVKFVQLYSPPEIIINPEENTAHYV